MNEAIVWLIIAAFYAPLHFMGPIGVVILITTDSAARQRLLRYMLIDCCLTMLIAFVLAIWLAEDRLGSAMVILLTSMLAPYLLLIIHRQMLKQHSATNP
jgi:hypothetical protein